MVFASREMATFPPASFSPMMPEPTTVARRSAVPSASATMRRGRSAAAATTGLHVGAAGDVRNAAPGLRDLLLHDGGFALDHEDLPRVPVGILDPHLVLQRVATLRVLLRE